MIIFLFVLLVVSNLLNLHILLFFCLFVFFVYFFTVSPPFYLPACYCKFYCNVMLNIVQ